MQCQIYAALCPIVESVEKLCMDTAGVIAVKGIEQHVLFTAPIHMWSLSEGLMLPYFLPQASTVCLLFWARKIPACTDNFFWAG